MKRKIILTAAIAVVLIIIAVASAVVVSVVHKKEINERETEELLEDVPMPGIAFVFTSTSDGYLTTDNRLYISSDGAILKVSEKVHDISYEEEEKMVKEKRYEDIFEQVGDTNPETVQKMYNLFIEVVIRGNYMRKSKSIVDIPERIRAGGDWIGYYEKDGKIKRQIFYETTDEVEVSDERALKIVDWMNEVLEPYKSPEGGVPKEKTKEDYPIPGIAFVYLTTWGDYLLICSNGKILKADKDKIICYSYEKVIKMAEEENYKDVMEYVGDTDAEKVREMYDIFVDSVLLRDYKHSFALKGKKEMAYWIAYYYYNYEEEEEIDSKELYETDDVMENIDERILEIVDWMNEVLEPYKQAEE